MRIIFPLLICVLEELSSLNFAFNHNELVITMVIIVLDSKLGSHCDIRLKWLWGNKQGSNGCFEGSKSEAESVHLHLSVIVNQYQFF